MSRTTGPSAVRAARWLALAAVSARWAWPGGSAAQPAPAEPPEMQTVTLKGTVLGPDGQPVPAAEVGVIDTRFQTLDQVFSGKCNEAGEFELVAPDLTQVYGPRATYCILARSADGTLTGAGTVSTGDLGRAAEIRLQASGYIHSSILDLKGQPLAGTGTLVVVKAEHVPGAVEGPHTNQAGELLIGPLPAGLQVGVDVAHEFRHLVAQNVWERKEITLQPGETYELPPLTLDPEGRSIEGALEDADGKPLPGAKVTSHLPQWPVNSTTADERGRLKLTQLPVRGYDVWLLAGDLTRRLYAMSPVDPDRGDEVRM